LGQTTDLIGVLVNGVLEKDGGVDEEVLYDYIWGLTFPTWLILSLTISLLLLISILACFKEGRNLGFYTGKRLQSSSNYTTRIIFLLASVLFILFTSLTLEKGLENLKGFIDTVQETTEDTAVLLSDGEIIAKNLTSLTSTATDIRDTLTNDLSTKLCPAVTDVFDQILDIDTNFTFIIDTTIDVLDSMESFLSGDAADVVTSSIDNLQTSLMDLDDTLDKTFDFVKEGSSLLIGIPGIIIPVTFMLGTVLILFGIRLPSLAEGILKWFFLPLLILQTFVCAIVASIMSIAGIANHDLCFPPTNDITTFFANSSNLQGSQLSMMYLAQKMGLDDILSDVTEYYLSGCFETISNPYIKVVDYVDTIIPDVLQQLNFILSSILSESNIEMIARVCNTPVDSITAILSAVTDMIGMLGIILPSAIQLLDITKCSTISPMLNNFFDTALCNYSITAFAWTVICLSLSTLMGLTMILFRSSFYNNEQ